MCSCEHVKVSQSCSCGYAKELEGRSLRFQCTIKTLGTWITGHTIGYALSPRHSGGEVRVRAYFEHL